MTETIAERVAAGAAWLDENKPGWVDRIDLDTLDLGDSCNCVIGQEYGDFEFAPNEVANLDNGYGHALGFNAANMMSEFEHLTDEWRQYITARRDGAV